MQATIRQCVVRLGAEPASLVPFLREMQRFGVAEFVVLTDAPLATAPIAASLPRPARLDVVATLAEAVLQDRFLACASTEPFAGNVGDVLAAAAAGAVFALPGVSVARPGDALPPPGLDHVTWPERPALFLDRDGVINVDHGYVGSRDRFEWMDGALDAIRLATRAGWHVFIVTNQSGVARGKYTEDDVRHLLDWIADAARAVGGTIDDVRYCPYHEDALVPAYRRVSDWRKPAPGMLLDLIRAWDLNPDRCIMIGDQATDLQAAERAGVAGHLFPGGNLCTFVRAILNRPNSRA